MNATTELPDLNANQFIAHLDAEPALTRAAEKINARLARAGAETEALTVTTETFVYRGKHTPAYGLRLLRVTFNWAISASSWTIVGVAQPINAETEDFTYMDLGLTREDAAITDPRHCDHCQNRRQRSQVFVLRHTDGRVIQVGGTCLQPHVGIRATKGMTALLAVNAEELFPDFVIDSEASRPTRAATPEAPSAVVLALALHHTAVRAGLSDREAERYDIKGETRQDLHDGAIPAAHECHMDRAQQIIAELTDPATRPTGDYWDDLARALAHEWISTKHFGLVASAPAALRRREIARERAAAEAAQPAAAEGLWRPIGHKIKAEPVEVEHVRTATYTTNYGYQERLGFIHILRTDDGHLLKWSTSTPLARDPETSDAGDVAPGERLRLTGGSVKALERYQGEAQTTITRVKFEALAPVPA